VSQQTDQHESLSDIIEEQERADQVAAAMEADGVSSVERTQQSYFGFEETHRVPLPDGISFIEHKTLNEGSRRKYLNTVNRDIMLQRTTGNAIMRTQQGDEKHALLEAAICGWNLIGKHNEPLMFDKNKLQQFLSQANPKIIDLIEKDIRKKNPWLLAEMTVEDIDKEIANLTEMRETKVKEEEGNEL
jgi:hypothetical protein